MRRSITQNSSQRQRWLATALLDIEPRLRKVMGYRHLPRLRDGIEAGACIGSALGAGCSTHQPEPTSLPWRGMLLDSCTHGPAEKIALSFSRLM